MLSLARVLPKLTIFPHQAPFLLALDGALKPPSILYIVLITSFQSSCYLDLNLHHHLLRSARLCAFKLPISSSPSSFLDKTLSHAIHDMFLLSVEPPQKNRHLNFSRVFIIFIGALYSETNLNFLRLV